MKFRFLILLFPLIFIGCSKPQIKMEAHLMRMQDGIPVIFLKSEPEIEKIKGKEIKEFLLQNSLSDEAETQWQIEEIKNENYERIILSYSGHKGPVIVTIENGVFSICEEYEGDLLKGRTKN